MEWQLLKQHIIVMGSIKDIDLMDDVLLRRMSWWDKSIRSLSEELTMEKTRRIQRSGRDQESAGVLVVPFVLTARRADSMPRLIRSVDSKA